MTSDSQYLSLGQFKIVLPKHKKPLTEYVPEIFNLLVILASRSNKNLTNKHTFYQPILDCVAER